MRIEIERDRNGEDGVVRKLGVEMEIGENEIEAGKITGVRRKWRKHQVDYKSTTVTTSVRMYNNAQRKSLTVISQEPFGGFI